MKRLETLFRRNRVKLWILSLAVVALATANLGAALDKPSQQWEYKTVWFKVNPGDDLAELQTVFGNALNSQAADGWEFAGRCAHVDAATYWADYVVLRRPRG